MESLVLSARGFLMWTPFVRFSGIDAPDLGVEPIDFVVRCNVDGAESQYSPRLLPKLRKRAEARAHPSRRK